jgi:hypothetical protein
MIEVVCKMAEQKSFQVLPCRCVVEEPSDGGTGGAVWCEIMKSAATPQEACHIPQWMYSSSEASLIPG